MPFIAKADKSLCLAQTGPYTLICLASCLVNLKIGKWRWRGRNMSKWQLISIALVKVLLFLTLPSTPPPQAGDRIIPFATHHLLILFTPFFFSQSSSCVIGLPDGNLLFYVHPLFNALIPMHQCSVQSKQKCCFWKMSVLIVGSAVSFQ
jgi:hypothetical protein